MYNYSSSGPSSVWLMDIGKTRKEVIDRLLDCHSPSLFGPIPGEIIAEKHFPATIQRSGARGLYAAGQEICQKLMALVRKRRTAQDTIRKIFTSKSQSFLFRQTKRLIFTPIWMIFFR